MNVLRHFLRKFLSLLLLLSPVQLAFASTGPVTMTYSVVNNPTGIPTLSGSMLVVLSLLLFVVTLKMAKQKHSNGGHFLIAALGVTALISAGGGVKIISDAMAQGTPLALDGSTGSVSINVDSGVYYYENYNPQILVIDSIDKPNEVFCEDPDGPGLTPFCEVGLNIPNSGGCAIECKTAVSDSRLKRDINYLTKLSNGIKLYSFNYKSGYSLDSKTDYVGVMAQDLLNDNRYRDAVKVMDNNFYVVNYASLGLKMITLDQWQDSSSNIYQKQKKHQVNFSFKH